MEYGEDEDLDQQTPDAIRRRLMNHFSGFPGGMSSFPATPRRFDEYFRCFPVAMMPGAERDNLNYGGKVLLPPSALEKLSRMNIMYPMIFELRNGRENRTTHAGVLEFIAEEGRIYLPHWMMNTLLVEPGDMLQVLNTEVQAGKFIKIQPQSTNFLDISDPKAVLEQAMRNYTVMTKDDIFSFKYNETVYEVLVQEVKPKTDANVIMVIETDLEVDFSAPLGYVEPKKSPASSASSTRPASTSGQPSTDAEGGVIHTYGSMAQAIGYSAIAPQQQTHLQVPSAVARSSVFSGAGNKLSGKRSKTATPASGTPPPSGPGDNLLPNAAPSAFGPRGATALRLPFGKLFFGYPVIPVKRNPEEGDNDKGKDKSEKPKPSFSGSGNSLRAAQAKDVAASRKRKPGDKPASPAGGGRRGGPKEVIEID